MGCGVYWNQVHEIERAMGTMRRFGISELSPAYGQLDSIRGKLMAKVGIKLPRSLSLLALLVGFSPGIIKLWHDSEQGWMTEARTRPGAPPVYKAASDEVAAAILKREITPGLEERLLTPDVNIDN